MQSAREASERDMVRKLEDQAHTAELGRLRLEEEVRTAKDSTQTALTEKESQERELRVCNALMQCNADRFLAHCHFNDCGLMRGSSLHFR